MPRVRLLLADDVGLGKTVEAGLIVTELINQRRIRRILIICPASIQVQWQEEMREKFNLQFHVIDRDTSFKIQRELGMDTNPWRTVPRIITSMDYISQANIFEDFKSASENLKPMGGASLPWDLIIVDEAHNFMPSPHGSSNDSQRSKMLRQIIKFFEHRLLLTATPHNGFTPSFTGLLEILDPLRFTQKPTLDDLDRKHINLVMIRRLKSELNQRKLVKRFSNTDVKKLDIQLNEAERGLFAALKEYKKEALKLLGAIGNREKNLGKFIFSLLRKRLLSSSYAFARTWWNHVAGYELEDTGVEEAEKSREMAEKEIIDDVEKDKREGEAARYVAGYFKKIQQKLTEVILQVSKILEQMGLTQKITEKSLDGVNLKIPDAKFDRLKLWITKELTPDEERLVIFTEYRDTQNYLVCRMKQEGWAEPRLRILFGGAPSNYREEIKAEFNNASSQLKILIATDTASEGLNLHNACRYVIHQDIPWNPMRLEQRNGRLDRHGQSRDVVAYHFVSDEDEDMKFLDYIAKKTNAVREDLGSAGVILDAAIMRHFEEDNPHDSNIESLDKEVNLVTGTITGKKDLDSRDKGSEQYYENSLSLLEDTKQRLAITPSNIVDVLNQALHHDGGRIERVNDIQNKSEYYRFGPKIPLTWQGLIDSSLKIKQGALKNALPKLFFDDAYFQREINEKLIFQIPKDSALIRIGHPIVQKSLTNFKRLLWDSEQQNLHRWTIIKGKLPLGFDACLQFSYMVSIRNELGELIDSFIEDTYLKIEHSNFKDLSNDAGFVNSLRSINDLSLTGEELDFWKKTLIPQWPSIKKYLYSEIKQIRQSKMQRYQNVLNATLTIEKDRETQLLEERIKELDRDDNSVKDLEKAKKERQQIADVLAQTTLTKLLFLEDRRRVRLQQRLGELDNTITELEWQRDTSTVEIIKKHLQEENERILNFILPKRYSLKSIEIFPVGIKFIVRA